MRNDLLRLVSRSDEHGWQYFLQALGKEGLINLGADRACGSGHRGGHVNLLIIGVYPQGSRNLQVCQLKMLLWEFIRKFTACIASCCCAWDLPDLFAATVGSAGAVTGLLFVT